MNQTQKPERPEASLAYRYKDALYLNITHKCPTACEFCIKFSWDYMYRSNNLLLKKEPEIVDIVAAAGDPSKYSEIVFCGYGESTYRLKEMEEIARTLKSRGARKIRLNTIGLGSAIHGRDIVPDLSRFLDGICISLNTPDPEVWKKIHRPLPEFKETGFEAVCDFIRKSAKMIPNTLVTAVDVPEIDRRAFEALVHSLGAVVRWRPYLDDYETQ